MYAVLSSFIYSCPICYGNPSLIESYLFFSDLRASLLLLMLSLKHIQKLQLVRNVVVQHLNEVSTYCWEHMWVLLLCHIYQLTEDALQITLSGRNGSVV